MKARRRGRAIRSAESQLLTHWLGKPRHQPAKQRVAFAWYTKRSWLRLRELAADPEALDDSYEAWLVSANNTVAALRSKGVFVEKFPLDVKAVASWCGRERRPFNSAARAAFVAAALRVAK